MSGLALLFTLAAVGISETTYLIQQRRTDNVPYCPIGQNCHIVLSSRYSRMFLFHNDIWGLIFYVAAAFVSAFLVIGVEPVWFWAPFFKIIVAAASAVSVFFTYLQWRVVRAWCFWCVMSAFTVWAMAVIILTSPAV